MFLVVVSAVVLPQVLVASSSFIEAGVGGRMKKNISDAAAATAKVIDDGRTMPDSRVGAIEQIAAERGVRIRVVEADGTVSADLDHESNEGLYHRLGAFFFGPDAAPSLAHFDAELGAVSERIESREAMTSGEAVGCRHSTERKLLVCHAALRLPGGALVYVQESSRRAIRALYDMRYQLLKLLLFSLPVAMLLAWWISRAVVGPVSKLRQQIRMRTEAAVPTGVLDSGTGDEIGELADSFNILLERLQERAKSNEAFVADLTHEFKNPVAAIRAAAERLGSSSALEPARIEKLAGVLSRSSSQLDRLVSEFLELARAEAGLANEPRVPMDLRRLVGAMVERLAADERYAGVNIALDATEEPLAIVAVENQLEKAIGNLIENAASFAHPSGEVIVGLRAAKQRAVLSVGDDGPGIAPENITRVFDRFFTTRSHKRGTGLGLALAKAIAEAHGGTISVKSTKGHGTTFVLSLPFTSDSHTLHRDFKC